MSGDDIQEDTNSSILTNEAVWRLIKLQKWFNPTEPVVLAEGAVTNFELQSSDRQNSFTLDIRRGRIELKYTMQMRANTTIRLVRLDFKGSHTNPDVDYHVGSEDPFYAIHDLCIGRTFNDEPHIHIYRNGFDDRWAYPVEGIFNRSQDIESTFKDFLDYCNIDGKYVIQEVLNDSFRRN